MRYNRRTNRYLQGRAKWDNSFHAFKPNARPYASYPCEKCHKVQNDPIHNVTAFGAPLSDSNTHFDEMILGVMSNIPENMIKDLTAARKILYTHIKSYWNSIK